jgi:hypothetical protein
MRNVVGKHPKSKPNRSFVCFSTTFFVVLFPVDLHQCISLVDFFMVYQI